jgi:DNA-binding CsgD family transcriptional regulator
MEGRMKYRVKRGLKVFKMRQADAEDQIRLMELKREKRREQLKLKRLKARLKIKRDNDRLLQRVAKDTLLRRKSAEIISRRYQGQTSRQISDKTGVDISRVRKYLRESGLSPIEQ